MPRFEARIAFEAEDSYDNAPESLEELRDLLEAAVLDATGVLNVEAIRVKEIHED